jgi:catechol 2,3-dioxygenase-like lactoylglutathione lyase family enzyme
MFEARIAIATVGVRNLKIAGKFYGETLGLQPAGHEQEGTLSYRIGGSELLVYQSRFAGTNQATAVTWIVADTEDAAAALSSKGVQFEHYDDLPETRRTGDVHFAGKLKLAWFKDPDGNIHALVSSH